MTKTLATAMTCPKCKRPYTPGVNGVRFLPEPGCDKCLGVVRDKTGAPWFPMEVEQLRTDLNTGKVVTVTREQALGQAAFKKAFGR